MVSIETRDCRTYYDFVRPRRIALTLADYVLRRRGICANPAAIVGAFVRIEEGAERPDAEIHFAAGASMQHADGKLTPTPGICATICRLRPDSVGSVHITSADANAAPAIRMNYLAHGRDASFQIRALRRLRRIFDAPALRPYIAGETRPGLQVASDAELLDYIRASSDTVHHPVGSCRMGTGVDAVVNPQLQVIGVENLRIADASVFPSTISGNTNASCIMVGEKAAELMVG
nr:GMC oxidoreductase [Rhodanobacter glycinis]